MWEARRRRQEDCVMRGLLSDPFGKPLRAEPQPAARFSSRGKGMGAAGAIGLDVGPSVMPQAVRDVCRAAFRVSTRRSARQDKVNAVQELKREGRPSLLQLALVCCLSSRLSRDQLRARHDCLCWTARVPLNGGLSCDRSTVLALASGQSVASLEAQRVGVLLAVAKILVRCAAGRRVACGCQDVASMQLSLLWSVGSAALPFLLPRLPPQLAIVVVVVVAIVVAAIVGVRCGHVRYERYRCLRALVSTCQFACGASYI